MRIGRIITKLHERAYQRMSLEDRVDNLRNFYSTLSQLGGDKFIDPNEALRLVNPYNLIPRTGVRTISLDERNFFNKIVVQKARINRQNVAFEYFFAKSPQGKPIIVVDIINSTVGGTSKFVIEVDNSKASIQKFNTLTDNPVTRAAIDYLRDYLNQLENKI